MIGMTRASSQFPRLASWPVEPGVGLGVVAELPRLRVPAEPAAVPVGEVAQVADGDGAGADFDVADWLLARADAVEPVLNVVLGLPARPLPDLGLLRLGLNPA